MLARVGASHAVAVMVVLLPEGLPALLKVFKDFDLGTWSLGDDWPDGLVFTSLQDAQYFVDYVNREVAKGSVVCAAQELLDGHVYLLPAELGHVIINIEATVTVSE